MKCNLTPQLMKALTAVRTEVKVAKSQFNQFGEFAYRSVEDLTSALNPVCAKHGCGYAMSDRVEVVEGRFYVVATVLFYCEASPEGYIMAEGRAREVEAKKGMDGAQITGACSSYARKYALCGLFGIDSGEDPDQMDNRQSKAPQKPNAKAAAQAVETMANAAVTTNHASPETSAKLKDAATAFADITGKTVSEVMTAVSQTEAMRAVGWKRGDMTEEQATMATAVIQGWIMKKKGNN